MTKKWCDVMSKINISIKVNDYIIKTKAIKKDDIITCIDNNDKKTKIKLNTQDLILTRENNEITIDIDFKNKNIKYYLKEHNKYITTTIKIKELKQTKQSLKIRYINEKQEFTLKVDIK